MNYIKKNIPLYFGYIILIISLITAYSHFDEGKYQLFFNSDSLTPYLFYQDLFVNGGDHTGWILAAAPTFFPDLLLYSTIVYLFKVGPVGALFIYSIVQVLLVNIMLVSLFKKTVNERYKVYAPLIPALFSILFIEGFLFSHDVNFAFFLCTPSYHGGSFVNALIALLIYVSDFSNVKKNILLFVFVVIASFCDLLFLPMFIGPFIVSRILTLKKEIVKAELIRVVVLIAGTLTGIKLYWIFRESNFFVFTNPNKMYSFENIKPSFYMFVTQMTEYVTSPGFRSFIIIFTFLSAIFVFIFYVLKRKRFNTMQSFGLVFFSVFTFTVIAAPIFNGSYTGYDTLRYNVHPFYIVMPILVLTIAFLIEKTNKLKIIKYGQLVIMTTLFILIMFNLSPTGTSDFVNYYPVEARIIDSVCEKHDLKRGITEYWTAKKVTTLSRKNIQVLSAYPEGNMHEFGSNINWYYTGDFDFVISNGFLPEVLKKNFKIKDTLRAEGFDILIVEKYIYPRGKYFPENKIK